MPCLQYVRGLSMKKILILVLSIISVVMLSACSKQVITVAGIISEEEPLENYIELQEFELKEQMEDDGREESSYCAVLIPEGYVESSEIPGMYVHPKAPLDSSNIYYTMTESSNEGQVIEDLTEADYEELIETAYAEAGQQIDLLIESFEQIDMEGIPGYKIRSSFEVADEAVEQLAYIILAENTCTVTYSQLSDDELMADFEISDGQIKLVREPEDILARNE